MDSNSIRRFVLWSTLLLSCLGIAAAQDSAGQSSAPDNTKSNHSRSDATADQQRESASDRVISQQIRKAIVNDKSLSTYAHNVKVITQNGRVTLAGPVRSEEERSAVEAKAVAIAGASNVTNQLQVAPSK